MEVEEALIRLKKNQRVTQTEKNEPNQPNKAAEVDDGKFFL